MINRGKLSLLAALALAMAGAACSSEPGGGFQAKSWVDTTMVNSLNDRGDTIVTNEQKGWYR
ncbi:MAG: hypothetical protein QOJ54_192 [Aliidongia sp.]|jgi:hypothetical protein|nr:hypothetical protein [Aliidongia sp.]